MPQEGILDSISEGYAKRKLSSQNLSPCELEHYRRLRNSAAQHTAKARASIFSTLVTALRRSQQGCHGPGRQQDAENLNTSGRFADTGTIERPTGRFTGDSSRSLDGASSTGFHQQQRPLPLAKALPSLLIDPHTYSGGCNLHSANGRVPSPRNPSAAQKTKFESESQSPLSRLKKNLSGLNASSVNAVNAVSASDFQQGYGHFRDSKEQLTEDIEQDDSNHHSSSALFFDPLSGSVNTSTTDREDQPPREGAFIKFKGASNLSENISVSKANSFTDRIKQFTAFLGGKSTSTSEALNPTSISPRNSANVSPRNQTNVSPRNQTSVSPRNPVWHHLESDFENRSVENHKPDLAGGPTSSSTTVGKDPNSIPSIANFCDFSAGKRRRVCVKGGCPGAEGDCRTCRNNDSTDSNSTTRYSDDAAYFSTAREPETNISSSDDDDDEEDDLSSFDSSASTASTLFSVLSFGLNNACSSQLEGLSTVKSRYTDDNFSKKALSNNLPALPLQCLTLHHTGGIDIEIQSETIPGAVVGTVSKTVRYYSRPEEPQSTTSLTKNVGALPPQPRATFEPSFGEDALGATTSLQEHFGAGKPNMPETPSRHLAAERRLGSSSLTKIKLPSLTPNSLLDLPLPLHPDKYGTLTSCILPQQTDRCDFKFLRATGFPDGSFRIRNHHHHHEISHKLKQTFHYSGQARGGQPHGWGTLVKGKQVLYEGEWRAGVCTGWYVVYHEFSVEIGHRSLLRNEAVAVSIPYDSDTFILPTPPTYYEFAAASGFYLSQNPTVPPDGIVEQWPIDSCPNFFMPKTTTSNTPTYKNQTTTYGKPAGTTLRAPRLMSFSPYLDGFAAQLGRPYQRRFRWQLRTQERHYNVSGLSKSRKHRRGYPLTEGSGTSSVGGGFITTDLISSYDRNSLGGDNTAGSVSTSSQQLGQFDSLTSFPSITDENDRRQVTEEDSSSGGGMINRNPGSDPTQFSTSSLDASYRIVRPHLGGSSSVRAAGVSNDRVRNAPASLRGPSSLISEGSFPPRMRSEQTVETGCGESPLLNTVARRRGPLFRRNVVPESTGSLTGTAGSRIGSLIGTTRNLRSRNQRHPPPAKCRFKDVHSNCFCCSDGSCDETLDDTDSVQSNRDIDDMPTSKHSFARAPFRRGITFPEVVPPSVESVNAILRTVPLSRSRRCFATNSGSRGARHLKTRLNRKPGATYPRAVCVPEKQRTRNVAGEESPCFPGRSKTGGLTLCQQGKAIPSLERHVAKKFTSKTLASARRHSAGASPASASIYRFVDLEGPLLSHCTCGNTMQSHGGSFEGAAESSSEFCTQVPDILLSCRSPIPEKPWCSFCKPEESHSEISFVPSFFTLAAQSGTLLRLSDIEHWSPLKLALFLRMIGCCDVATLVRRKRFTGSDVLGMTEGDLIRRLGIVGWSQSARNQRKFLLAVFRYAYACSDRTGIMLPPRLRSFYQSAAGLTRPELRIIPRDQIELHRRLGSGGYADVYAASYDKQKVACKIFTWQQQRETRAVPPSPVSLASNCGVRTQSAALASGGLTSVDRWKSESVESAETLLKSDFSDYVPGNFPSASSGKMPSNYKQNSSLSTFSLQCDSNEEFNGKLYDKQLCASGKTKLDVPAALTGRSSGSTRPSTSADEALWCTDAPCISKQTSSSVVVAVSEQKTSQHVTAQPGLTVEYTRKTPKKPTAKKMKHGKVMKNNPRLNGEDGPKICCSALSNEKTKPTINKPLPKLPIDDEACVPPPESRLHGLSSSPSRSNKNVAANYRKTILCTEVAKISLPPIDANALFVRKSCHCPSRRERNGSTNSSLDIAGPLRDATSRNSCVPNIAGPSSNDCSNTLNGSICLSLELAQYRGGSRFSRQGSDDYISRSSHDWNHPSVTSARSKDSLPTAGNVFLLPLAVPIASRRFSFAATSNKTASNGSETKNRLELESAKSKGSGQLDLMFSATAVAAVSGNHLEGGNRSYSAGDVDDPQSRNHFLADATSQFEVVSSVCSRPAFSFHKTADTPNEFTTASIYERPPPQIDQTNPEADNTPLPPTIRLNSQPLLCFDRHGVRRHDHSRQNRAIQRRSRKPHQCVPTAAATAGEVVGIDATYAMNQLHTEKPAFRRITRNSGRNKRSEGRAGGTVTACRRDLVGIKQPPHQCSGLLERCGSTVNVAQQVAVGNAAQRRRNTPMPPNRAQDYVRHGVASPRNSPLVGTDMGKQMQTLNYATLNYAPDPCTVIRPDGDGCGPLKEMEAAETGTTEMETVEMDIVEGVKRIDLHDSESSKNGKENTTGGGKDYPSEDTVSETAEFIPHPCNADSVGPDPCRLPLETDKGGVLVSKRLRKELHTLFVEENSSAGNRQRSTLKSRNRRTNRRSLSGAKRQFSSAGSSAKFLDREQEQMFLSKKRSLEFSQRDVPSPVISRLNRRQQNKTFFVQQTATTSRRKAKRDKHFSATKRASIETFSDAGTSGTRSRERARRATRIIKILTPTLARGCPDIDEARRPFTIWTKSLSQSQVALDAVRVILLNDHKVPPSISLEKYRSPRQSSGCVLKLSRKRDVPGRKASTLKIRTNDASAELAEAEVSAELSGPAMKLDCNDRTEKNGTKKSESKSQWPIPDSVKELPHSARQSIMEDPREIQQNYRPGAEVECDLPSPNHAKSSRYGLDKSTTETTRFKAARNWRYTISGAWHVNDAPGALKNRNIEAALHSVLAPHPFLVNIYGITDFSPRAAGIILEYCGGGSLDELLYDSSDLALTEQGHIQHGRSLPRMNVRFPSGSAALLAKTTAQKHRSTWSPPSRPYLLFLFEEVAWAMHYLHRRRVLHRDLKLSNVLVTKEGNIKISDLGIATPFLKSDSPSSLATYGNAYYAAPEVLTGEGFFPSSDVWSYGVALWEALTGQLAFDGVPMGVIFVRLATRRAQLTYPKDLPPALKALLRRILHPDWRERPNFSKIARKLNHIRNEAGTVVVDEVQSFFGL